MTTFIRRLALSSITASLIATTAWAHSDSETTVPADGSSVSSVEEISIEFEAPMQVTSVKLMQGETDVELDRQTGMEAAREFRAVPGSALEPGSYQVDWRGLSADGHPMQGSFAFTVEQ